MPVLSMLPCTMPIMHLPPTPTPTCQGNAEFGAGRFGPALELYNRALALHPSEPGLLNNRLVHWGYGKGERRRCVWRGGAYVGTD